MPDYQQMYLKLFNQVTDVIEELQRVQRETEELYIQDSRPGLVALERWKNEKAADQKPPAIKKPTG